MGGLALLRSLPALLAGAALLILGVLFSMVVLVVVAVAGLGLWAWLWWKTRELRRAARDAAAGAPAGGQVFEGESVVITEEAAGIESALPRTSKEID